MQSTEQEIREALSFCSDYSYDTWIFIGMALKAGGYSVDLFAEWSSKDPNPNNYSYEKCVQKWNSFKSNGINIGTLFYYAQQNGWKNTNGYVRMPVAYGRFPSSYVQALDRVQENKEAEDDLKIKRLRKILQAHNTAPVEFIEPDEDWNPEEDLIRYVKSLYRTDENIGINTKAMFDKEKNKWHPCDNGRFAKVSQFIAGLEGFSVPEILKRYNTKAGVWCRINPMTGEGSSDKSVIAYRHTLIESDDIPVEKQIELMCELQLPISALVYSGLKSVHAICLIEAENSEQYDKRVNFMFDICNRYGLKVDTNNKNPSRLSRLPGVIRGEHKQFLIATHTGCKSFVEWQKMITKGMYGIVALNRALARPTPLKPELIEGVLRVSHKMMIAAPSKAGKTFILMFLSIAIATGTEWLGFRCRKSRVLYLNMEIDQPSAENRFNDLLRVLGYKEKPENIELMHLRGEAEPLDTLAVRIIEAVRETKENYDVIFVDPIYKVLKGDENSNSDMAEMAKAGDLITEETGAALVYCHHFSKGTSLNKKVADRASGAGAFVRDVDALITLTAYDERTTEGDAVFSVDFVTREFKTPKSMMVKFQYPLFEVVSHDMYPDAQFEKKGQTSTERNEVNEKIRQAYSQCEKVTADNGRTGVRKKDLLNMIQRLYPDLIPQNLNTNQLRNKEKSLIENNSYLKNVGKEGKNAVICITSSAPIENDDVL